MVKIKSKEKMSKKGVLLTLGAFIILMVILSLAILIFHNTQRSEERIIESSSSDRVFDLFSSVKESIIEIFSFYAGFNVTIEKNADGTRNITFVEDISKNKTDWGGEFDERIDAFKNYVESQEPHIKIFTEELKKREVPLIILPHNIQYSRDWGTGHVMIIITPEEYNFNSYDVLVNTHNVEISKISSTFQEDSFNFRVKAIDNHGNSFVTEETVDPTKQNEVRVDLGGGGLVKVTLKDTLEIWTNSDDVITVTLTIDNLEKIDEEVTVEFPANAIYINFEELNISKNSTIKLA